MSYDNRGQVSLWRPQSDNPKAPALKGSVVAHRDIKEGETLDVALWKNESDNPKAPVLKGKVSDKRESAPSQPAGETMQDDEIPFSWEEA